MVTMFPRPHSGRFLVEGLFEITCAPFISPNMRQNSKNPPVVRFLEFIPIRCIEALCATLVVSDSVLEVMLNPQLLLQE
ncbi:hypothetical protein TNCV_1848521 [Trichonephila clavipes]|nr:hypothetical protein TNCV_1848521 [Trichonephila clavipes]